MGKLWSKTKISYIHTIGHPTGGDQYACGEREPASGRLECLPTGETAHSFTFFKRQHYANEIQ